MPETPKDGERTREQAAQDYVAQFDIQDEPSREPIPDDPEPQPRRTDGTFRKPHPATLAALAKDLGFSDEEVSDLPTEELDRAVKVTARHALRLQSQSEQRRRETIESREERFAPQPAPVPEPEADPFSAEVFQSLDPAISDLLKRQHKEIKELKGLKDEWGQFKTQAEQSNVSETSEMIDDGFESLGEGFHRFVGAGRAGDGTIRKDSDEYDRRVDLLRKAGIDPRKRYSQRAIDRALKTAAQKLFGPALKKAAEPYSEATGDEPPPPRKPPARKTREQDEWDEGGVARPTQRAAEPLPLGRNRAIREVGKQLQAARSAQTSETNGFASEDDFPE